MSIKDFFLFLILGLSGAAIAATIGCDAGTNTTLIATANDDDDDTGIDPTPGNECDNIGLGTLEVVDYYAGIPVFVDYVIVEDEIYVPGSRNDPNEVNIPDIVFCTVDYTLIINVDGYASINWTDFTFDPGLTTVRMVPITSAQGGSAWYNQCLGVFSPEDCTAFLAEGSNQAGFDLCLVLFDGGPCCYAFRDLNGVFLLPDECYL